MTTLPLKLTSALELSLHEERTPAFAEAEDKLRIDFQRYTSVSKDKLSTSFGVTMEDESFGSECEGDDAESEDVEPNSETLNQFKEHCTTFNHNYLDLSGPEITSIKLLDIMKRKKAPLNSFEDLLEWHLKGKVICVKGSL